MTRPTSSDGWLIGTLAAVCVLGACRREEAPAAVPPPGGNVYSIAVVAATANDLPPCSTSLGDATAYVESPVGLFRCTNGAWAPIACNKGQAGNVAYASESQTLLACVSGQWTPVPLPPGPPGPQGPQGDAGVTTLVAQLALMPGTICPNGGTEIESGPDTNGNGQIEATEVTSTSYVCTGATGPQGPTGMAGSASVVTSSIEPPGSNCPYGGVKLTVGLDQNGDGKIENGEVTSVSYVCSGAEVTTGPTAGGAGLPTTAGSCASDLDCDQNYFCNGRTCDLKAVQITVGLHDRAWALLFNGTVQRFDTRSQSPSGVPGLGGITQIAAGGANVCAVVSDGTVVCGDVNFNQRQAISALNRVRSVAAGSNHVCALKVDGSVWCWGDNSQGQLGPGTTASRSTVPVMALAGDAVAIASGPGSAHTCALLSAGALSCWGARAPGISAASRLAAIPVPDVSDVTSVSVGSSNTCVLTAGTLLRCWSDTTAPQSGGLIAAVTVGGSGPISPSAVDTDDFFCVLAVDGSVSCSGSDGEGQLGTGTTKETSSGTTVKLELTRVQSIASGTVSSCAILSNGSVSCWGPSVAPLRGWAMGTPCSVDSDCSSGACLGGLCCTAACPSTDQSCAATACDSSGACVYPDPTTTCGAPSCTGSTLTSGACDTAGNCLVSSSPCDGQLACDPSDNMSCLTSCAADTDCAPGSSCDVSLGTCNSSQP